MLIMLTRLEEGRGAVSNLSWMLRAAEKAPTLVVEGQTFIYKERGTRRNGFKLRVEF